MIQRLESVPREQLLSDLKWLKHQLSRAMTGGKQSTINTIRHQIAAYKAELPMVREPEAQPRICPRCGRPVECEAT